MPDRHLPVRPDLDQLEREAAELLEPGRVGLEEARHTLAESYGVESWPRLVLTCRMTAALWRGDG